MMIFDKTVFGQYGNILTGSPVPSSERRTDVKYNNKQTIYVYIYIYNTMNHHFPYTSKRLIEWILLHCKRPPSLQREPLHLQVAVPMVIPVLHQQQRPLWLWSTGRRRFYIHIHSVYHHQHHHYHYRSMFVISILEYCSQQFNMEVCRYCHHDSLL